MEDFQKERDEWNKEKLKRLDFINKRLHDEQDVRQAITNLEEGMREYYQVFGRKIKPLPPGACSLLTSTTLPNIKREEKWRSLLVGTTLVFLS